MFDLNFPMKENQWDRGKRKVKQKIKRIFQNCLNSKKEIVVITFILLSTV